MRYSPAEKMEIIRLVEESDLSVTRTLQELDVARSTFYRWYRRYEAEGYEGLRNRPPTSRRFWNKIPEEEKASVVETALERPEMSPRELAWYITDSKGAFISESSVYRILKSYDLVTSPAYIVMAAADEFAHKTRRIHELWQTDFTYMKIVGWGWYYLSTILDDYSRYIIAWKMTQTMSAEDVKDTLDMAIEKSGVDRVRLHHKDLKIALEAARELGVALPATALVDQIESGLIGRGFGDEDVSAIARTIRELSGIN